MNIYPNPSNGLINVELDLLEPIHLDLSIINFLGEEVFSDNIINQKSQYKKKTIDFRRECKVVYIYYTLEMKIKISAKRF